MALAVDDELSSSSARRGREWRALEAAGFFVSSHGHGRPRGGGWWGGGGVAGFGCGLAVSAMWGRACGRRDVGACWPGARLCAGVRAARFIGALGLYGCRVRVLAAGLAT